MNLRLTLLTQNTALRLYRAPPGNQLLKRLGPAWHAPTPDSPPLPTPTRSRVKTTLRTLAARVPPKGPRINPFPDLPEGAPHWDGRVTLIPKQIDGDYTQIAETLTDSCRQGLSTNLYCEAILTNKNREDGRQLGAASATLYQNGREGRHVEKTFGETITEADAQTRALTPALDAITLHLANKPADLQETFTILTPSNPALRRMLDPSTHKEQAVSLGHLKRLSELLAAHPNINFILQWLPRKTPFVGFRRAKQLAQEAIRTATDADMEEPHTIKKQKETAKDSVIAEWADKWHKTPHNSFAYRTAIRAPPDGRKHHSFQPSHKQDTSQGNYTQGEQAGGQGNLAKFSRLNHSTLYHFITGHAFTGEYTQRFYPHHTQEQIACPCGEQIQTIEHVLLHCPLHTAARRKHLTANGRPRTLPQLFDRPERILEMLHFLKETSACSKPRAIWEPG